MSLDDWQQEEPTAGFADRVMNRIGAENAASAQVRTIPLRSRVMGAFAAAAAIALVVAGGSLLVPAKGEELATVREEVHIGRRATAVLEPGAHVAWDGNRVNQSEGDVFYRVERSVVGTAFHVVTPSGDVEVLGTCFRVRVEKAENEMNNRDLKFGSLGAALTAAVLVSVYEGKVSLSHAADRVVLTAGESAHADDVHGVQATGAADGVAPNAAKKDPLLAANANLADSVREYRRRLEAIEAQKATVEKQLADAKQKILLAANDGQAGPAKNAYDLSQDDWKDLAREGKVLARMPCARPDSWNVSAKSLSSAGLAPEDATAIHDALQASAGRIWATVRPLCIQALQGDAVIADKLGQDTCVTLVSELANQHHEDTAEELRKVSQIRAGLIPMPTDPSTLGTYGQIVYAMSGESKAMEQQLGQTLGPDVAHKFVFGDNGNWCNSSWSGGPTPTLPPGSGQ